MYSLRVRSPSGRGWVSVITSKSLPAGWVDELDECTVVRLATSGRTGTAGAADILAAG